MTRVSPWGPRAYSLKFGLHFHESHTDYATNSAETYWDDLQNQKAKLESNFAD
jgi:hypothetical protein